MRRLAVLLLLAGLPAPPALRAQEAVEEPAETPAVREPVLLGPRTAAGREKALRRHGGNAATERAVDAGLDWLARHALPDGGWDADGFPDRCAGDGDACDGIGQGQHGEPVPCPFDGAITGLATLAFLGRGHLPGAEGDPYGALVESALERLRGAGDTWTLRLARGCFAEAEALERRGRYRADVESGVRAILGRRQDDGAWGYAAPWRPGSDVPYAALCVQALVAARDAGVELPEDLGEGVAGWLATLEVDDKGRTAYLLAGREYGYTPTTSNAHCAAAMRELLRSGLDDRAHGRALGLIDRTRPAWKISFRERTVNGRKVQIQVGHLSMYQWWYGTLATFQRGGSAWSGWWGSLKGALVGHQRDEGCAAGSWDPLGTYERQTGGRVFATALGVLMLEQPYRHRRIE